MEALGITPFGLIAYAVNFALLAVLLRLFLYKPVKEMLHRRQTRIAEGLEAADKATEDARRQQSEFQQELATTRREAEEESRRLAEANEIVRRQVLDAAEREAQDIKERARQDIERERQQVALELEKEATRLAVEMTRRILAGAIDEATQSKLVDSFLAGLGEES